MFLSKFDENEIYNDLKDKVLNNKPLSDEDVMRFIILPLTKKKDKQELIEKSIDLAKQIKDENTQEFIIAGIVCVTDKFINKNYSNKIKEWISMTKLARLYEEEKMEAVKKTREETWAEAWEKSREETWAEAWEKSREQALNESREQTWTEAWEKSWEKSREQAQKDFSKVIVKNMLNANKDIAEIMQMTGLSENEILLLKD